LRREGSKKTKKIGLPAPKDESKAEEAGKEGISKRDIRQ